MNVKQVIVIRKDLKMRRGKEIAQGAHASVAFLAKYVSRKLELTSAMRWWMNNSFAKICCQVSSEEELLEIYTKALQAGLEVNLITDSGKTEFDGVPTNTCLAIGPDEAHKIDQVSGHLKLY